MISVIIPTYNREVFVQRALESVLAQTFQDIEIIVIDDGSTDKTAELFEGKYKHPKIRYVNLGTNQGVNKARNRGIDEARGDIIAFLDSDDELFPHALETIHTVYTQYPDIGFVGAPFRTPDGEVTGLERTTGPIPFEDLLCERGQRRIKTGFATIRRNIIGTTRWEVKYLQFIFFRRIEKRTQSYYHAEPLGIFYPNSDQYSVTKNRARPNLKLSIERAKVLDVFLDEMHDDFMAHCPANFGPPAYGAGMGLLLAGKKGRAIQRLYEAFRVTGRRHYLLALLGALFPFSPQLLRALYRRRERNYAASSGTPKQRSESGKSHDK